MGYGRGSSVSCGTQRTGRWGRAGRSCSAGEGPARFAGCPEVTADTERPRHPATVGLLLLHDSWGGARVRLPRRPGPGVTFHQTAHAADLNQLKEPFASEPLATSSVPGRTSAQGQPHAGGARSRQTEVWHSRHRPDVLTRRPRAPGRRQRFSSAGNSFGLKQGAISSRPSVLGRNQVLFHKRLQSCKLLLALI